MLYRVELTRKAEKEFSKMDRIVREFLLKRFEALEKAANPLSNAARLVNNNNLYRHRFGDYRIIFSLEKDGTLVILLVLKVAHRKDIYRDIT